MLANSKKRVIIVLVILTAHFVSAYAQFFVEGSAGMDYGSGTSYSDKTIKFSTFNVSPKAGYRLNENMALGLSVSLIRSTSNHLNFLLDGTIVEGESRDTEWGFAVFDRYKIWEKKKFSFLIESSVYISKLTYEGTSGSSIWNETSNSIGVKALPLISYDLSDRFSIIALCDFLSLDLYSTVLYLNDTDRDTELKTRNLHFEFAGQSVILNNLSNIRIGIIYHFNKSNK